MLGTATEDEGDPVDSVTSKKFYEKLEEEREQNIKETSDIFDTDGSDFPVPRDSEELRVAMHTLGLKKKMREFRNARRGRR